MEMPACVTVPPVCWSTIIAPVPQNTMVNVPINSAVYYFTMVLYCVNDFISLWRQDICLRVMPWLSFCNFLLKKLSFFWNTQHGDNYRNGHYEYCNAQEYQQVKFFHITSLFFSALSHACTKRVPKHHLRETHKKKQQSAKTPITTKTIRANCLRCFIIVNFNWREDLCV